MKECDMYVAMARLCETYLLCDSCPVEAYKPDHDCGSGKAWSFCDVPQAELHDIYRAMIDRGVIREDTSDQRAKSDAGKPRLTLVPPEVIWHIAAIREYGNRKYPEGGVDNWMRVEPQRYRDAAFRHFMRYLGNPRGRDEESGYPHLWHCLCNLAFLDKLEGYDEKNTDSDTGSDQYDDLHG